MHAGFAISTKLISIWWHICLVMLRCWESQNVHVTPLSICTMTSFYTFTWFCRGFNFSVWLHSLFGFDQNSQLSLSFRRKYIWISQNQADSCRLIYFSEFQRALICFARVSCFGWNHSALSAAVSAHYLNQLMVQLATQSLIGQFWSFGWQLVCHLTVKQHKWNKLNDTWS